MRAKLLIDIIVRNTKSKLLYCINQCCAWDKDWPVARPADSDVTQVRDDVTSDVTSVSANQRRLRRWRTTEHTICIRMPNHLSTQPVRECVIGLSNSVLQVNSRIVFNVWFTSAYLLYQAIIDVSWSWRQPVEPFKTTELAGLRHRYRRRAMERSYGLVSSQQHSFFYWYHSLNKLFYQLAVPQQSMIF